MSDINSLRAEIDSIDREMTELLRRRMDVALGIAEYKRENGLAVEDASREQAVLEKIRGLAGEELAPYAEQLYRTMFDISKQYQRARIAEREG